MPVDAWPCLGMLGDGCFYDKCDRSDYILHVQCVRDVDRKGVTFYEIVREKGNSKSGCMQHARLNLFWKLSEAHMIPA